MGINNIKISVEMIENEVVDLLEKWLVIDSDFSDLVLGVIQGMNDRVSELEIALRDGQVNVLKDQVHSLKGVTGNFHMAELYELFWELDTYLKENKKIDKEVEDYIRRLKHFVKLIPQSYEERVILPPKFGDDVDVELSILMGGHMKEIAEILIQLSYEYDINIESAENGLEVLEKFYMASYDFIILKNEMEIMSGKEVEEELSSAQSLKMPEIMLISKEKIEKDELIKKVVGLIEKRKLNS
jgi:HPt (histidine-containing phosphotransfer) domain-containing protein